MSEYGETLARYRDEAGLSQRELGAAIGLDYTQLNKIEHGHRPPLRAKYMKPLVRALRLEKSKAENLVDLAGQSRKVLDFMDEAADGTAFVQGSGRGQPTPAGAPGSGVGFLAMLNRSSTGQQQPDTTSRQRDQTIKLLVTQIEAETQITLRPENRMLAERLISEIARSVCEVAAKEQDQQRR